MFTSGFFSKFNLVKVCLLSFHEIQFTVFASFAEAYLQSCWEIEVVAEEKFCIFVIALVTSYPIQRKDPFPELFRERNTTNGVGIRTSQGFNFVDLYIPILIVERLCSSGLCSSGNIMIVFKLPVSPASKVYCHQISQSSDLLCALFCT